MVLPRSGIKFVREWPRYPALLRPVGSALIAVGFVVAYGLEPLYSSNQNERFLHGFARSGLGHLRDDWLASTPDPFPVFSKIVELTSRYGAPWLFYGYQAALIVFYFAALVGIANAYRPLRESYWFLLFVSLLFLVHSSAADTLYNDRLGFDVAVLRSLREGAASQHVLGSYFQPSAFGILLVASIWAYLRHRILLAAILAAAAPVIHFTYLLPAFSLSIVYIFGMIRQDRHFKHGLVVAVVAALIVFPSVAYTVLQFVAASPETQAEARQILVEVRGPHHSVPAVWFRWDDVIRVALIAAALIVVRRTRLFAVLAVPAVVGSGLTAIQLFSGSNALALVYPWRVSVVLVPVATAVLLAAIVSRLTGAAPDSGVAGVRRRLFAFGLAATLAGLTVLGGAIQIERDFAKALRVDYLGVAQFLKADSRASGIALVPPKGLDAFRLESGLPIVVDWKSVPYTGPEVLEWHRRYQEVSALYNEGFDCERVLAAAATYDAKWVVWPVRRKGGREIANCPGLVNEYADRSYVALRVSRDSEPVPEMSKARLRTRD